MKQQFIFLSKQNIPTFFQIFSSISAGFLDYLNNFKKFESFIQYIGINEKTSFILTEDNKPIGIFLGAIRGNAAYIPAVGVLCDYRRQGYGRILLQKGISLLLENNCKSVSLDVLQSNTNAINLYNSEGFEIKNEIVNYRNENNSFFIKNNTRDYMLINDNAYTFHFLHKTFHKNAQPWQKGLRAILMKIQKKECELFIIQKDNITTGYIVISSKNNCLQIHDMGLKKDEYHLFPFLISSILGIEKIVQANSFYSSDPLCKLFEQNGFYMDTKQYEMKRRLL